MIGYICRGRELETVILGVKSLQSGAISTAEKPWFVIQHSSNINGPWETVAEGSKECYTLHNIASNKKHYFRACCVNRDSSSEYSQVVEHESGINTETVGQ